MQALAATGYVADVGQQLGAHGGGDRPRGGALRLEHGALGVDRRHQPAYRQDDILADTAPTLDISRVTDNAIMVDYVSVGERWSKIFDELDGVSGLTLTSYMMGFHPSDRFTADERIASAAWSRVGDYAAVDGNGAGNCSRRLPRHCCRWRR